MVYERPRPQRPQSGSDRPRQPSNPALARTERSHRDRPDPRGSGGGPPSRDNRGGGGGSGGGGAPSPWLTPEPPPCSPQAGFVEYLRWSRDPLEVGKSVKDVTKALVVDKALQADYRPRLRKLTERTRLLARTGVCFEARVAWRLRVGGSKGPESMLLPAFDATGLPYVPSSALRGAARAQALRQFQAEGLDVAEAERAVAPWFGSLAAEGADRIGKVAFLDAYPLPDERLGGLAADMANNLWSWKDDQPTYGSNPNLLLSLRQCRLCIGLRPLPGCTAAQLQQIEAWLRQALVAGIGSQVNSGYGVVEDGTTRPATQPLLELDFTLEGQLSHGHQQPGGWNPEKREFRRGTPVAEARATALKGVLRYWFRALALGALPPQPVRDWEAKLFGAIEPKPVQGYLRVQLLNGAVEIPEARNKEDDPGFIRGRLRLLVTDQTPVDQRKLLDYLMRNLVWLSTHLGGLGQGARRPCYSRETRRYAPWWRGNDWVLHPEEADADFWTLPETAAEMADCLAKRLRTFYTALSRLTGLTPTLRPQNQNRSGGWEEIINHQHARILVCAGPEQRGKPFALAQLHDRALNPDADQGRYNGDLCGSVGRQCRPSPVWVANHRDGDRDLYQIVTIFGAEAAPRSTYLKQLRQEATVFQEVFPRCLRPGG